VIAAGFENTVMGVDAAAVSTGPRTVLVDNEGLIAFFGSELSFMVESILGRGAATAAMAAMRIAEVSKQARKTLDVLGLDSEDGCFTVMDP
jgi:hypothetical protein